ncbi:hypothetical protein RJ639_008186 [Escallonia herrerae]|uniref:Thioredoxin domain-containing protein n=2 Tax=Escallonia herrerae TaxID=1293975 RepID=A0AA88VSZ5_9ASTE|nr:hypothetical protein RJ639_008186 [Escallonia herrerae]
MAEVMIKTCMYSPCNIRRPQQQHHKHRASLYPVIFSSAVEGLKMRARRSSLSSSSKSEFYGRKQGGFVVGRQGTENRSKSAALGAQMSIAIGKAQRWWEKGLQPNMKEVQGAQDLVDSLFSAGDKLVVVDFFSPGCGGCKALHPKICQLAEMNPDVQFLQVNYEQHKSMCYALNVHVLPFFRFYRGAHGRLCSFSCTNATIKKFKDALAKHSPDRCSLEPPRGLEEKELIALSANKELSFNYTPKPAEQPLAVPAREGIPAEPVLASSHSSSDATLPLPLPLPRPLPLQSTAASKAAQDITDKSLVASGR